MYSEQPEVQKLSITSIDVFALDSSNNWVKFTSEGHPK